MEQKMTLTEFNLRFMFSLQMIDGKLRDKHAGHARHPLIRTSLLREVQVDLKHGGLDATIQKWEGFIR